MCRRKMTTLAPRVIGVSSFISLPLASVRVVVRSSDADPLRDVKSFSGVTSSGMLHGCSCGNGEERKRGYLNDDVVILVAVLILLANILGGVNADEVVGKALLLDADAVTVEAARIAVAHVVNLMEG